MQLAKIRLSTATIAIVCASIPAAANPPMTSHMMRLALEVPRFHIESIRSAHNDTLFATTAVKVTNPDGTVFFDSGSRTVPLGDHKGKETVTPNLRTVISIPAPPAPLNVSNPGVKVVWTFILTNSGHHEPSAVEKAAGDAATALVTAAAEQGGSALQRAMSPVGPSESGDTSASDSGDGGGSSAAGPAIAAGIAAALAGVKELISMLTADCDGVVAQQTYVWTAHDLFKMVVPRKIWSQEKGNPGTDSPAGCGDNSKYDVNFRVFEVPAAPAPSMPH